MMKLVLDTAPSSLILMAVDAMDFLRIDNGEDEELLEALLEAVRQNLEGPDGTLGRALLTQTWKLYLDHFPYGCSVWGNGCHQCRYHYSDRFSWYKHGSLRIPLPPLQQVIEVKYFDTSNVEQTLDPALYTVETKLEPGLVIPAFGTIWPATYPKPDAVSVKFKAGYGDAATSVPQPIRQAMLGRVASMYENRGTSGPDPQWVKALLAPYKFQMHL